MISLKQLLKEVMGYDEQDIEESKAGDEAKRQGLEYMSFGRYGKDGKVTHKSVNGKLQPVKGGAATPAAKTPAKKPAKQGYGKDFIGGQGRGITPRTPSLTLAKPARAARGKTPSPSAPAKRDKNALTAKNVNPKADIKGAKKQITTRYQSALRANNIDIIDDSVPGMLLLGTPGGGNSTDFTAIGQQADGQWAIRPVSYIDKKNNPVFYDIDNEFTVEPTLDAAMQSHYGMGPSKQPKTPAKNDNYRDNRW